MDLPAHDRSRLHERQARPSAPISPRHPGRHLCRNDPSLHRNGKKRLTPDRYQARSTENPSRSYLARDSAGTPGSTIIPSTSVMAAITYGEAAFNFSAETNT